ncbi:S-layer homology domain-containing protein [Paenibacillus sp. YYML68]|uniref:S-layer homology domain-containing protein n=1 Tax=Paenibacillus sp. YYML68 TaxID=2909250 RepID=UPI0024917BEF|nr:S-layer homology domain-containing protein [Paenibacillus sp. YYML68]
MTNCSTHRISHTDSKARTHSSTSMNRSRMKTVSRRWLCIVLCLQLVLSMLGGSIGMTASASESVAKEVMIVRYHVGQFGTWFTLANVTDRDIDLSGWKVNDYASASTVNPKWTIPDHTVIKAKSLLIFEKTKGSGTADAAAHGVPVIPLPVTFGLSRGGERLELWNLEDQQVDQLAFKVNFGTRPPLFFVEGGLNIDQGLERVSMVDTDTAEDWRKETGTEASPVVAWSWAPLSGSPSPTAAPVAAKTVFDNTNPSAAKVTGQAGAVEADSVVKLYSSADKSTVLATTNATAAGAFEATFNNASSLQSIYASAQAGSKPESALTALQAVVLDNTPPSMQSVTPLDGSMGAALDAAVKAVFDEPITAGPKLGDIVIVDAENEPISSVSATVAGHELVIAHAALKSSKSYTVKVPAGAVNDTAGNGNVEPIQWTFTTIPEVKTSAHVAMELSKSAVKPGETLDLAVMLDDYAHVYGLQFQVKYDPSKLRVVGSMEPGDVWNDHEQATFVRTVDETAGLITFGGTLVGEAAGMSGDTPMSAAKLTLEAIGSAGTTSLTFPTGSVKAAAHPSTGAIEIVPTVAGSVMVEIEEAAPVEKARIELAADEAVVSIGQPFTVSVNVYQYTNLYGAQLRLSYDAAKLMLQDDDLTRSGIQVKAGTLFNGRDTIELVNEGGEGQVVFASTLQGSGSGVTGHGPSSIVELTFIPTEASDEVELALVPGDLLLAGYPQGSPAQWQLPYELAGNPLTVRIQAGSTDDRIAPEWPEGSELSAEDVTATSVKLSWPVAQDNVAVTGYRLLRDGQTVTSVTYDVYSYVVDSLTADTTYQFELEALDAAGNVSPKLSVVVKTTAEADTQAPTWPQGAKLEADSIGQTSARLKWTQATDNVAVAGYRIERGNVVVATVTDVVYNVTGLWANTSYSYKVTAFDAAGHTSAPLTVQFTTQDDDSGSGGTGGGSGGCCAVEPEKPEASWSKDGQAVSLNDSAIKIVTEAGQATVTVDEKALEEAIKQLEGAGQQLIVSAASTEPKVQFELPADLLAQAVEQSPKAVLVLKSGDVSYELPMSVIGFKQLASELKAELGDLTLRFTVTKPAGAALEQLKAGMDGEMTLLKAAEFTLTLEGAGSSKTVSSFNGTMVTRKFQLDANVNVNELTGVRFDGGKPVFVPTLFTKVGNLVVAHVKSATNSMYGVVQHKQSFPDLASHWSKADVEWLASKLIVQGMSESSFQPDADITRAEFAALLVRALALPAASSGKTFTDVASGEWYSSVVNTASQAGLIEGFEDGSFQPQAKITREQMAVMIARALKHAGKQADSTSSTMERFSDQSKVSVWAKTAMSQTLNAQIMNGMTDTALEPSLNATRAQATVMLKRLLLHVGYMNAN